MLDISFPDGVKRQYAVGTTPLEIANGISKKLGEKTLAAKLDDVLVDSNLPIETSATISLLTWDNPEGKYAFWHSSAHIMAETLESFYPGIKLGIGPPIDEGFYYDIDFGEYSFSQADFEKVEKKFLELAQSGETFQCRNVPKAEAVAYFTQKNDPYKLELIDGLADGAITFYTSGNFVDLCKGPHIPNSKVIKAFKILNIAGAYWRGDAKNKQLTRIYAISFPTQKELDEYLFLLEEAKKRDHRKLGAALKMFSFHEEGPGFPFWHHNGMIVMNELQYFLRNKLIRDYGYQEIKTPAILDEQLWIRSGHYNNYKENMYFVTIDEANYALKPMNCPGSCLVYKSDQRSYRDLPLRMFEFGNVHRHELSGVLTGLFRVRSFTQDDAHIFCQPEDIQAEITTILRLIFEIYHVFGFNEVDVYLSTRPEKYIGELSTWDQAESALTTSLNEAGIPFTINEGDGAFYGPKIDFVVKDSLKRTWQLGTIQLDYSMPERFGLEYIGSDNQTHRPVMIHRALFGSFERFFGVLLEHTGGDLPLWLSPCQIKILPIADKFLPYCQQVLDLLKSNSFRASIDDRNEKIGRKIRDAEMDKIPLMFVVGEKEVEQQMVAIREHKVGDVGTHSLDQINIFTAQNSAFTSTRLEYCTILK
jgi:threonyl-tRNA synthetase